MKRSRIILTAALCSVITVAVSCKDDDAKREDFAESFRPPKCTLSTVTLEQLKLLCDEATVEYIATNVFDKLKAECADIKKLGFDGVEITGPDGKMWMYSIKPDSDCTPPSK